MAYPLREDTFEEFCKVTKGTPTREDGYVVCKYEDGTKLLYRQVNNHHEFTIFRKDYKTVARTKEGEHCMVFDSFTPSIICAGPEEKLGGLTIASTDKGFAYHANSGPLLEINTSIKLPPREKVPAKLMSMEPW